MKKLYFIFLLLHIYSVAQSQQDYNPQTVNGAIYLTNELNDSMAVLYGTQDYIEQGISIKLWRVHYQDDLDTTTGITINTYMMYEINDANILSNKVAISDGYDVEYSISNIPEVGNYAVLVYFNAIPNGFITFSISDSLDDGTERANLNYRVNVNEYLDNSLAWGIYSIPRSQDANIDLQNLNFITFYIIGIGTAISYNPFDWFRDITDLVWEGGEILAGFIITGGVDIYQSVAGIAITLIETGDLPRYRTISSEEYAYVNNIIFNGDLPPPDQIIITNLHLNFSDRATVLPSSTGLYFMHLGYGYDNPLAYVRPNFSDVPGQVFMHEMTHVWQLLNTIDLEYYINVISGNYDYFPFQNWNNYNFEQQASVVENCYNRMRSISGFSFCELQDYVVENIRNDELFNFQNLIDLKPSSSNSILKLKPGVYNTPPNYTIGTNGKKIILNACEGEVTIGQN
jgi:hypothetical protein